MKPIALLPPQATGHVAHPYRHGLRELSGIATVSTVSVMLTGRRGRPQLVRMHAARLGVSMLGHVIEGVLGVRETDGAMVGTCERCHDALEVPADDQAPSVGSMLGRRCPE